VCQRGAFEVGVDLLDDRVVPVDLVGGDGVEAVGVGAGEERVGAPHVEQGSLAGGLVPFSVGVGDPAHDEPARDSVRLRVA